MFFSLAFVKEFDLHEDLKEFFRRLIYLKSIISKKFKLISSVTKFCIWSCIILSVVIFYYCSEIYCSVLFCGMWFPIKILNDSLFETLFSDGRRLPLNRRQHVFPNGTLLLENVQNDPDRGIYQCTASNKQGRSATQTLPLSVIGSIHPLFCCTSRNCETKNCHSHWL